MQGYEVSLFATGLILVAYKIMRAYVFPRIEKTVEHSKFKREPLSKAVSFMKVGLRLFGFIIILFIWGFDFQNLMVLASSLLTVVGVALFASWSILSNVSAFFILLMDESFKRGNFIRVVNGDNYIEGYISTIDLINTTLITETRETIKYPNNLIVINPTIVCTKTRLSAVGKTMEYSTKPMPVVRQSFIKRKNLK